MRSLLLPCPAGGSFQTCSLSVIDASSSVNATTDAPRNPSIVEALGCVNRAPCSVRGWKLPLTVWPQLSRLKSTACASYIYCFLEFALCLLSRVYVVASVVSHRRYPRLVLRPATRPAVSVVL